MSSGVKKISEFFTHSSFKGKLLDVSEIWVRSCGEEILEPIEGKLSGKIPEWLNGSLVMNGPGLFTVGETTVNHLYDGMALLQKFSISSSGKITYQNKFIKSEAFTKGNEEKRLVLGEFGTGATADKSKSLFKKITSFVSPDESTDNSLISIFPMSGNFLTFTQSPRCNKIDPKTLESLGGVDVGKKLDIVTYTAFPHVLKDGTAFNLGHSISPIGGGFYNIVKFPNDDQLMERMEVVAKLPSKLKLHPSNMNMFGITENYFIIVETPFTMSVTSLVKLVVMKIPLTDVLKWLPSEKTRIMLVNRATGKLDFAFFTDPFYFLYIVNQYEKDDQVVLDICCYKNADVINATFVEALRKNDPKQFHVYETRVLGFVLPLSASEKNVNLVKLENSLASAVFINGKISCTPELMTDVSCIFPSINYSDYCGVEYQFFYSVVVDFDDTYGSLVKVDLKNKTKIYWKDENSCAWQPTFVPSPDANSEDDGVVVAGISYFGINNKVGFIILNAKDFTEIARCDFINLPTVIPKALHGMYIAEN